MQYQQVSVVMYVKGKSVNYLTKKRVSTAIVSAIDELGDKGEIKVTEWIRGGELAWMEEIEVNSHSVYYYGKGSSLNKEWWRIFIRQAAAAGYINRIIKTASFGTSNRAYAQLNVTEKTRDLIASDVGVCCQSLLLKKKLSVIQSSTMQYIKERGRERVTTWCLQ